MVKKIRIKKFQIVGRNQLLNANTSKFVGRDVIEICIPEGVKPTRSAMKDLIIKAAPFGYIYVFVEEVKPTLKEILAGKGVLL